MSRTEKLTTSLVGGQNDNDDNEGFTQRMLMSMVFDVSGLAKDVERVKVQVFALARQNGVPIPHDDD